MRIAVRAAIVGFVLCAAFTASASQAAPPAPRTLRQRVDRLVLRAPSNSAQSTQGSYGPVTESGPSYEDLHSLGPGAFPRLNEILADMALKPYWANATGAVACIGGPGARDILRTFIWKRFSGPVDRQTFSALAVAIATLGLTITPGDRELVPLLEEHADPQGWNDIRWTVSGKPHRELAHDLASEVLGALGSCGTREARSALLRLKRKPGLRDLREEVGIVLRMNDEVMRIGYREYSRRERERYRSGRD